MDLTIKKDERAYGKFYHKMPRCGGKKTRAFALVEITESLDKSNPYNRNYISRESDVLMLSTIDEFEEDIIDITFEDLSYHIS